MKAFPTLSDNCQIDTQNGMSLLDYFAAKAMQSKIMRGDFFNQESDSCDDFNEMVEDAIFCYKIANAMIEAKKFEEYDYED